MTITLMTAIGALAALTGTLVGMLKHECVDLEREEALSTTQTRILLNGAPEPGRRRTTLDQDERWY